MSEDLKPCPFCQGKAHTDREADADWPSKCFMFVRCSRCGVRTGSIYGSGDPSEWAEARETWNTRLAGQQGEARPAREEREAFEAWAVARKWSVPLSRTPLKPDADTGGYWSPMVHAAWEGWHAHAALATQAAPEAQAEPAGEPVAQSDADFWLRNRLAILGAIQREGYTLISTRDSFSLMRLGKIEAQAAHPSAAASGERDTLRALLREARGVIGTLLKYANVEPCADEISMLASIDAALADGGAK